MLIRIFTTDCPIRLFLPSSIVRVLGVSVSSDLTYHKHIESIVSAATKKIYMIPRCFHSKDISVLRRILISFIRLSLEYGSNIWSPWSDGEIDCLQKIQDRFTALAYHNASPSYAQRLRDFNIPTLGVRQAALDLVMNNKIIAAKTRQVSADLFTMNDRSSHRSNSLALVVPICRTSAYLHSFAVRSIHAWNTLPDVTVLSRSSSQFFRSVLHVLFINYSSLYSLTIVFFCLHMNSLFSLCILLYS